MLGEREDDITLKSLRAGAASATEDPSKVKIDLKPFNQKGGKANSKKAAQSATNLSGQGRLEPVGMAFLMSLVGDRSLTPRALDREAARSSPSC